jgi:ribosomal protein S18 acetylase RimI-like enzyme
MTSAAVRPLLPDEADAATGVLARAFHHDPLALFLSPDEARRDHVMRWFFGVVLRYGQAFGEVWVTDDLGGVAIWWAPPFVEPTPERAMQVGLGEGPAYLGADIWDAFMEFGATMDAVRRAGAPSSHWYLNVLGVEPAQHGQGVGSRLLAAMFEQLDRAGLPAYLETMTAANVAYYERRGFVLTSEEHDPMSGMHLRGMRRDPVAPTASA